MMVETNELLLDYVILLMRGQDFVKNFEKIRQIIALFHKNMFLSKLHRYTVFQYSHLTVLFSQCSPFSLRFFAINWCLSSCHSRLIHILAHFLPLSLNLEMHFPPIVKNFVFLICCQNQINMDQNTQF